MKFFGRVSLLWNLGGVLRSVLKNRIVLQSCIIIVRCGIQGSLWWGRLIPINGKMPLLPFHCEI
jgi:hypothetical protein